ncbi:MULTISPECIES: LuxR family transcriptional regulator [unclassified Streptomyces]|uniref:helix-turn-helix transcriptional regulator n=1 Tax=unclassified Streptomyces TaxID=2593676 RepID=UPI00278BDDE2|nr:MULTISPECIES: LuxR family transcriptional regulator [unclassified Streptomyces]
MPSPRHLPHGVPAPVSPRSSRSSSRTQANRTPPESAAPRLRGREQQWARLLRLLDTARGAPRRGGVALVEGVAGSGRSRLLGDAGAVARQCGFSVVHATADEVRHALPLAPLIDALHHGPGARLAAPDPEQDPAGAARHTWQIDRLQTSLEKQLCDGPMLVVVDDLHWADQLTLAALRTLAARFAARPVVWLFSRRTGRANPALDRLFTLLGSGERAERILLPPLDAAAVRDLVADRLAAEPTPELLAYAEGADGNPAALAALLDGLAEEHRLRVADGRARLAGEGVGGYVPRRFGALIRQRVAAFRPETRQLLDVASILGRAVPPEDVAEILGETTASALPALREALDARIMVCEGDDLAFCHELVRLALFTTLPGPLRGALHRQAAKMIITRDGGVLPAAAHLVHGARRGDADAVTVLCSAATSVTATEPDTAAQLALRALDITGPADPARPELVRIAVEALSRSGPLPRAITLAEEALARSLPRENAAVLRCRLTSALLLAGRPAQAIAVTDQSPRPLDACSTGGPAERISLMRLHSLADLYPEAAEKEAWWQAERRGTPTAGLLCVLARCHWRTGQIGEALRLARTAADPDRPGDEEHSACWPFPPRLALAAMLTRLRETAEAEALLRTLHADIEAAGWPVLRGAVTLLEASLALTRGDVETAAERATAGLRAGEEAGLHRYAPLGRQVLADIALRRGDLAAADGHAERLARTAARRGPGTNVAAEALSVWTAGRLAAARHDPDGVGSALAVFRADRTALRVLLTEEPAAAAWLTRTAIGRGDTELAGTTVRVARQLGDDSPSLPSPTAAAAHAEGLHAQDPEALRRAARTHRDPWSRASAAEDLGSLYGADRPAAVPELERAMAEYARLGAVQDEARVRSRLRRLGVRRRHWSHEDRPTSGWGSLTETERRVADLVAQGLTNRQAAAQMFLSPHTVGFHLRQIFRKLGLQSRIDLARTHPGTGGAPPRNG